MMVFITGIKGFIGRELAVECRKQGIEIIGVDVADSSEMRV